MFVQVQFVVFFISLRLRVRRVRMRSTRRSEARFTSDAGYCGPWVLQTRCAQVTNE